MQVFEFHFNPKEKKDTIFDTFCFEPETSFERRMGSLYMAGLLKNTLPQHKHFLNNLAQTIKEKYYKTTLAKPGQSLRESLRRANELLEGIARRGDVSWLGNLGFCVLSIKNFELKFTRVGNFKIVLLRKGQLIDIDQRLRFQEIEPYPLKVFGNIVSGKLAENDILLILTTELFVFLQTQKLIQDLAGLSVPKPVPDTKRETIDQNKIKDFFNQAKDQLLKVSGLSLLIVLSQELASKEKAVLDQKRIFSLKKAFQPVIQLLKRVKVPLFLTKPKLKKPTIKLQTRIKVPSIKIKKPKILLLPAPKLDKKVGLVLFFIVFVTLGFFIFEKREKQQLKAYMGQLSQIEEKVEEAKTYLLVAESKPQAKTEANLLFQESLKDLTPLITLAPSLPQSFAGQIFSLKETISEYLYQLNGLVSIPEPELFFEFQAREFIPQKLVFFQEKLYFFSPYGNNVFQLNQEGKILTIQKHLEAAAPLTNSLLFLSKPDQIVPLKENQFQEPITLKMPFSDFNLSDLAAYQSNLYLLEKTTSQIIKYPYSDNNWGSPQSWLGTKKATDFKSMAVDGSVWILTKDNSIEKYYGGYLQTTFTLEIFPEVKSFSKIFTSPQLPYLYLLEPGQKRIVLLNKTGRIQKQYQSEKFDTLMDFAVSPEGKTIYLLNGLKVYKITL